MYWWLDLVITSNSTVQKLIALLLNVISISLFKWVINLGGETPNIQYDCVYGTPYSLLSFSILFNEDWRYLLNSIFFYYSWLRQHRSGFLHTHLSRVFLLALTWKWTQLNVQNKQTNMYFKYKTFFKNIQIKS
jgi:hypothetical protein